MTIYGSQQLEIEMPLGFECRLVSDTWEIVECDAATVEFHVLDDGSYEIEWIEFYDKLGRELFQLDDNTHNEMVKEVEHEVAVKTRILYDRWDGTIVPEFNNEEY